MKSNPLNHIKIASPCSADWDKMYGNHRQRFCSECKLNVYNISEMTQPEAEDFILAAEGRVCLRLYRRRDGTVITQDCPVGWQAVKQRASRFATATFGLIIGFFGGWWATGQISNAYDNSLQQVRADMEKLQNVEIPNDEEEILVEEGGLTYDSDYAPIANGRPDLSRFKEEIKRNRQSKEAIVGRVDNIRDLKDEPVEFWVK